MTSPPYVITLVREVFPKLSRYRINEKACRTPEGCDFNIINFVNVEYSRRGNPIQLKYISNLAAASETAKTLFESLQKGKKEGEGHDSRDTGVLQEVRTNAV